MTVHFFTCVATDVLFKLYNQAWKKVSAPMYHRMEHQFAVMAAWEQADSEKPGRRPAEPGHKTAALRKAGTRYLGEVLFGRRMGRFQRRTSVGCMAATVKKLAVKQVCKYLDSYSKSGGLAYDNQVGAHTRLATA